jgi:hypothetical protein
MLWATRPSIGESFHLCIFVTGLTDGGLIGRNMLRIFVKTELLLQNFFTELWNN